MPHVSTDAEDPSAAATSAGPAFQALRRLRAEWGIMVGKGSQHATCRSHSVAPGAISSVRFMRRTRGDVYCVLRCEGRVRRTAQAPSRPAPVWREDVAFKTVGIGSDLQVLSHRTHNNDSVLLFGFLHLSRVFGAGTSGRMHASITTIKHPAAVHS